MLKVAGMRCEYRENPLGIGTRRPRFGWALESDGANVLQESYRIQVSESPDFSGCVWDSGQTVSDQSINVEYGGDPLKSRTRYYWRVRIADRSGEDSGWSGAAWLETAILDPGEWKAGFISAETPEDAANSEARRMRRVFSLNGKIRSARLYATAKGIYEAFLNGKRVGDWLLTPGWTSYKHRLLFQTYDVTDLLQDGENVLGAAVGPGWYKGALAGWLKGRNLYGNHTAFLAELHIQMEDGSETVVTTDGSWKFSGGPVTYTEIYHGETYDARREQTGWDAPGFDDSGWLPVYSEPDTLENLLPQDGLPVRRQEVLQPVAKIITPKNEIVFDFGQNLTGWVRLRVRGTPGARVAYDHAEILDADGNFYTENLRSAKEHIEYLCKGAGDEVYEPHFTFQGFRYIRIEAFPGDPELDNFEAVVVHSDMRPIGTFRCSSEMVNQLAHNILWGMKGNFVDIPTDCPQRDERLGWTGDAQVFIRAASFMMETAPFFEKWLHDLKAEQLSNGGVPHVIPDVLSGCGEDKNITEPHSSCAWADASVICPWTIYRYFGDKRLLEEQYRSMKGWVEYIRAHAQDGLIWNTGFHFADWLALDTREEDRFGGTPKDLVATAYYSYSAGLLAKAARVLGYSEDARIYEALQRNIAEAFRKEFYTATGRLAANTQTAHVLALWFGLTPPEFVPRTIGDLAKLVEASGGHLTTGFAGTPYLCHALSKYGRTDLAYELVLKEDYPSWLYPITKGATTMWEHWDGIKPDGTIWDPDMNSYNHYAYGAVGDWLYSTMAGLDTAEDGPAFKHTLIAPRPGKGITSAEASCQTGYGNTAVRWKLEEGAMTVEATIAHNTTATVTLPGAQEGIIGGVSFHSTEQGVSAEVGSGHYVFCYQMDEA